MAYGPETGVSYCSVCKLSKAEVIGTISISFLLISSAHNPTRGINRQSERKERAGLTLQFTERKEIKGNHEGRGDAWVMLSSKHLMACDAACSALD